MDQVQMTVIAAGPCNTVTTVQQGRYETSVWQAKCNIELNMSANLYQP
jgi:hypothetical protein